MKGMVIYFLLTSCCFCELFAVLAQEKTGNSEILEQACIHLFSRDLGYALVGAKPMALEELNARFCPVQKTLVLSTLAHEFDGSNFIFRIERPVPWLTSVFLVNKSALRKTIKESVYLQKFVAIHYQTIENFFHRLGEISGFLFEDIFFYDDRALGLAFGYGQLNVDYYLSRVFASDSKEEIKQTMFCLNPHLSPFSYVVCKGFPVPKIADLPVEQPPFLVANNCRITKQAELENVSYEFPQSDPPYLLVIPTFIAQRSMETEQILLRYHRARNLLARQCRNKPIMCVLQDIIAASSIHDEAKS